MVADVISNRFLQVMVVVRLNVNVLGGSSYTFLKCLSLFLAQVLPLGL